MIIEFTDLQCPYCARFARDTWPQLRERYIDTGKVRFATRDLPLPFHEFALPAAVASRCAGRQGKFWEYREALFRDQSLLGRPLMPSWPLRSDWTLRASKPAVPTPRWRRRCVRT